MTLGLLCFMSAPKKRNNLKLHPKLQVLHSLLQARLAIAASAQHPLMKCLHKCQPIGHNTGDKAWLLPSHAFPLDSPRTCSGLTSAKDQPSFRSAHQTMVRKFDHTKAPHLPLPSDRSSTHSYGMPSTYRSADVVRNCGPQV